MSESIPLDKGKQLKFRHVKMAVPSWEALPRIPRRGTPKPIVANTNNPLFAVYKDESFSFKRDGIYEFDIIQKKYNLLIKYPKDFVTTRHSICYNPDKHELCIYNEQSTLIKIDINTHKFQLYKNQFPTGQYGIILCINNEYHIIGGSSSNQHLKWLDNEQDFQIMHTFKEWDNGILGHGVIYLPSKNKILVFNGYILGDNKRNIDDIYEYLIDDNEWIKLQDIKIPKRLYSMGHVVTKDENFVIIFGGAAPDTTQQTIWIWNLSEMKFYISDVKCPVNDTFHAVIVNYSNDLAVYGFVRRVCKANDLNVPDDIGKLMENYYKVEYIHLTQSFDQKHWKIPLYEILNSKRCAP